MSRQPKPQRTDQELLRRIERSGGGKAHYKQLIREFGLGGGRERRVLLEQLQAMVRRKQLVEVERGVWALPKVETVHNAGENARWDGLEQVVRGGRERLVSGRLDLHRDGFGFVRQDEGKGEDIFIAPNEIHGAMQGDSVLVDEFPPGRDGRRSGRIARVLTRRNPTVVGVFHYADAGRKRASRVDSRGDRGGFRASAVTGNFVVPMDERVASQIEIPQGMEIVVAKEGSPHRMVGDEAKTTWEPEDPERPLEGIAVDIEITHFPSAGRPAKGRVIEVLGPPDAFGVDVEMVIRKHHIPHAFPPNVLAEADESAKQDVATVSLDSADEFALREDFRGLPSVTIDGETARDFDDAVLVRDLPNENTELQVHIADVSWYVRPGSAIDTEARVRGTSVYFPDRAVPMLPHALSSGMCSLLPNEDRLVLSCVMEIDARGEVVGYRVAEGVIRSVRRCTYTSVQRCLNASAVRQGAGLRAQGPEGLDAGHRADAKETQIPSGDDKPRKTSSTVAPEPSVEDIAERERVEFESPGMPEAFDAMLELALRLNAKRVRRGSIDFDLPEPVVEFDPDGNMKAIVKSERGWAHRLIEEFMLSANECVATWLESQGIASIYRIHEVPDPKRIVDFEETAAQFGQSLGIGNLPVKKFAMKSDRRDAHRSSARGRDSRPVQKHEVPESIPVTPQMYQKLVRRIAGTPEERILAYLMLRSLKQARYAEKNEGHFALASPSYTHFTSPIRRYPDLIVHRLLRAMLWDGADARGGAILSTDSQPWGSPQGLKHRVAAGDYGRAEARPLQSKSNSRSSSRMTEKKAKTTTAGDGPMSAEELSDIAVESSQAERRSADAERELIEWKKIKFMADKVGDDFHAVILSVTKYGFFVELNDLFIEGLVPISSLVGDYYTFRDTDRTIVGARSGHVFALGQKVEVILDRIDRQEKRLQFALLPGTEPKVVGLRTRGKVSAKKDEKVERQALSPKRSGKAKTRTRNKKNKGRR